MTLALQSALWMLVAVAPDGGAVQLTYEGAIEPVRATEEETSTTFRMIALVQSAPTGNSVTWVIDQARPARWPWTERFGRVPVPRQWSVPADGPAVLHEHPAGATPIPLLTVAGPPLPAGSTWTADGIDYRVVGQHRHQETLGWKVEAKNAYGWKRTLLVEKRGLVGKESPVLLALTESVFVGGGREYRLKMTLTDSRTIDAERTAAADRAFRLGSDLRRELDPPKRPLRVAWSPAQREILKRSLPAFAEASADGPLNGVARAAADDARDQDSRADTVAARKDELLGKRIPAFRFETLEGEALTDKELAGKVTVLHFWDYRDSPLQPPYGQAGYLDFLHRRFRERPLRVVGVSVDPRIQENDAARKASRRSAAKFKEFMNLSYPLVLDTEDYLRGIGDPRRFGSRLPLYLVLDRQGRVIHYSVGEYELDTKVGLAELHHVVTDALNTDALNTDAESP